MEQTQDKILKIGKYGLTKVGILAGLVLLFIVTLSWTWIGYVGSDDGLYLYGAQQWISSFPFVPDHFGLVRHTVTLPIAFNIWLLGESEFSLTLSTILYFAALLTVTYFSVNRFFGFGAAVFSTFVLIVTPLYAVSATIASVDMPILFFVASSFWAYIYALNSPRKMRWLVLSGICAGLAIISRETAGSMAFFFAILLLAGFRLPRKYYLLIAAGALAVLLSDILYYWIFADNPLHRWDLFLQGAVISKDRAAAEAFSYGADGNFRISKLFDPFLLVLFNQEFGLTYFVALGSTIYYFVRKTNAGQQRQIMGLFILITCIWFIGTSLALHNVKLLARYYYVPTYFLLLLSSLVLLWGLQGAWRKRAGLIISMLLAGNFLCIYLENKNPQFGEKKIIEYAQISSGIIYTDERTVKNIQDRLAWHDALKATIMAGPPPAGALFFLDRSNAYDDYVPAESQKHYYPGQNWEEIKRYDDPDRWIKYVVDLFGVDKRINKNIYRKITDPNPDVVIYKIN